LTTFAILADGGPASSSIIWLKRYKWAMLADLFHPDKVMIKPPIHWVYMLLCDNHSYYTGYTVDLLRRYREHQNGSPKCKYTRSFKPLRMVQCWPLQDKSLALHLERKIKRLSRLDKERLIAEPAALAELIEEKC
jgi:putative endonuclease